MRILGIDPGLSTTGYGLIESNSHAPKLLEAGVLHSAAGLPLEKRLLELYRGISEIIGGFSPASMAVEALFSHYSHPRPALQMAHARGVFLLAASQKGIPVFTYEPTRVKKSLTGRGGATKSQIQQMIQRVFQLPAPPSPPDVADALAIALCHANTVSHGHPVSRRSGRRGLPEHIEALINRA